MLKDEGVRRPPVLMDVRVRGPSVLMDVRVRGPPVFKDEGVRRQPPVLKSVGSGCSWLCSLVGPLPLIPTTPPIHLPLSI